MTRLTIGIKALNEEQHIAAAIESALAAAAPFQGTVVLADSGSADATIAIARRYPIRIVQLADPSARSCGAGAQLAFQSAGDTTYFYLLDGDMVLEPAFIAAAARYLDETPDVAGVGGLVREVNLAGQQFQIRAAAERAGKHWRPGAVDRLDCGGLYRVSAIEAVGYFADRNLHAFEEFELAARLRQAGWKLVRIDQPAIQHYGHTTGGYRLLWRRLSSGYAGAAGEVLRGALGRRHLGRVLRGLGHIRNALAVMAWWLLVLALALYPMTPAAKAGSLAVALFAPLLLLSVRRRSFSLGFYSLVAWNIGAVGLLLGLSRKRTDPAAPIAAVEIETLARQGVGAPATAV